MRGAGRETRGKVRHSTPCCVHEDDPTARLFGAKLSKKLGQQVVIDNRPGAGATIGHGLAAKAAPDELHVMIRSEHQRWGEVIREAGIAPPD